MSGPRRLSAGLVVVFVAVALEPAGPRPAGPPPGPAGEQPRVGQPCQVVDRYPVSFTKDAGGAWIASFAFAGGATHGHLRVPDVDARMIAEHDAYVSDVRLGSYEPPPGSQRSGLVCRVGPTYHFYCPAKGGVDRFCLTWAGEGH